MFWRTLDKHLVSKSENIKCIHWCLLFNSYPDTFSNSNYELKDNIKSCFFKLTVVYRLALIQVKWFPCKICLMIRSCLSKLMHKVSSGFLPQKKKKKLEVSTMYIHVIMYFEPSPSKERSILAIVTLPKLCLNITSVQ